MIQHNVDAKNLTILSYMINGIFTIFPVSSDCDLQEFGSVIEIFRRAV